LKDRKIFVFAIVFTVLVPAVAAEGHRDPQTGRIKVLYIGDPTASSPYPMLESDPLILPYPVKACAVCFSFGVAKRSMRQYMPRTYGDLSSYQVFILSDTNAGLFTAREQEWFVKAVRDAGSGLVMVGGNEAFGACCGFPSWGPTRVQEILPVVCLDNQGETGRVEVLKYDNPFVASMPIHRGLQWMRVYGVNRVEMRTGAEELARIIPPTKPPCPFWATWRTGAGRTFAITGDWTPAAGVVFMRWEYYGDFAINLMMYLSDNPLPKDLQTLHEARRKFLEYRSSKTYLFNVMDFAERFGASMNPVEGIIQEAELKYSEAKGAYLDLDYPKCLDLLNRCLDDLSRGTEKAMRLKDQAMLWIYVIEWTAVAGTFFAAGFLVWSLMIRRKLYREVDATRFSR